MLEAEGYNTVTDIKSGTVTEPKIQTVLYKNGQLWPSLRNQFLVYLTFQTLTQNSCQSLYSQCNQTTSFWKITVLFKSYKQWKKYVLVSTTEISLLMSRTYICFCNYSVGWASFDHLHHLGKYNSTQKNLEKNYNFEKLNNNRL